MLLSASDGFTAVQSLAPMAGGLKRGAQRDRAGRMDKPRNCS
jgi:hypothetical protein